MLMRGWDSKMIRTHGAGTLRAKHAGERISWPAGWRGGATTAA